MRTVTFTQGNVCERFQIPSVEAWNDFAQVVANCLEPGDILALSGELGAGKTTFVQALSKAFGIRRMPQSPTFALLRTYPLPRAKRGIKRLIHVDAYRIEKSSELLALDLDEELFDGQSILVMEWPEKAGAWLKKNTYIKLDISTKPRPS